MNYVKTIITHLIERADRYVYIKDKEGSNFKAKVEYGGKSGEGKRVQVEVNYADVLILNVVIRNTKSKIYPDKLQVMYKFAPESVVEN